MTIATTPNFQVAKKLVLLVWLLATITIGLQSWVGDSTIYAKSLEQKREEMHFGILSNEAPGGGSWGAVGGLSIQTRVGVVYLAEGLRNLTGLSVAKIYKLTDTFFLFLTLLALFFYLRRWLPDTFCLVGVLYFSVCLPLTYPFQLFHPWDRPQLALWIGLLYLVAERRLLLVALGLALSILVKFDTVLLPFFYFMVHYSRRQWARVILESGMLTVVAFGTYGALGWYFPAPLDVSRFTLAGAYETLVENLRALMSMNMRFPPLLVHLLPLLLALTSVRSQARFAQASVIFAIALSLVFILFTRYEEVRAHMVVLVLLLPSALLTLSQLITVRNAGNRPI